jgi:4-amino-4-deoxy-L-arabinose transferase-like glycosyltransferase
VCAVAALFAAIAAGLFVELDREKMWRSSEERCYAVVGEMLSSGDWLLPRLNGAVRLQKPPLFYWAAAATAELAGGLSLWTLRSVSALAALGLGALVFGAGVSLGGFRTGMLATGMLGASLLFYDRGRTGDAEMLLALLVFAALVLFERLWRTRDSRLAPVLALAVGLAFLTKATAALLSILAPIVLWLTVRDSLRLTLRPAALLWSGVALAIGVSWYVVILASVPDAAETFASFLVSPFGIRAGNDARHLRELWYYWPRFPISSAPTGLLLPWLAYEAYRQHFFRDQPSVQFWALGFVAALIGWTFVPAKQMHYLLPLVPMQALVAARVIEQRFFAKT